MLKTEMKRFVYMVYYHEQGFTFVMTLAMVTVLSISLPFLGYLIQIADYESNYDELSVHQFFQFVRDDFIRSDEIRTMKNIIYLEQSNSNVTATIELYQNLIRRQVNGQGHEIYLRDVKDISFTSLPYGLHISVTCLSGETYEKTIAYY